MATNFRRGHDAGFSFDNDLSAIVGLNAFHRLGVQPPFQPLAAPAVLHRGQAAIVSYETDTSAGGSPDAVRLMLLEPATSGTVLYLTDRSWNGSAFAAAGGGDGTLTITLGADMPAGTILTYSAAQLSAAGITLSNGGETLYLYQGTSADAPTTFLFAADIADGNTTFNGNLSGTGLTNGLDAVAVGFDNANFAGAPSQIAATELLKIANTVSWNGSDQDDIGGTGGYTEVSDTTVSNAFANPDMALISVMAGGGQSDAILRIGNDEGANVGSDLTRLFRDDSHFNHLSDISLDIENGFYFVVDSDGNNINRILRGNVGDLVSGTASPSYTQIFATDGQNGGVGPVNPGEIIVNIEANTTTNKIYWMDGNLFGDFEGGFQLWEANYDGTGARLIQTIDDENPDPGPGFPGGVGDFAIDTVNGYAYVTSSAASIDGFGAATVNQNHILQINLATGEVRFLDLGDGVPQGYHDGRLDPSQGQVFGIDVDQRDGTVYFTTQPISANDHGGIFKFTLGAAVGDTIGGTLTELWEQPTNNAFNTLQTFPTSNLTHIEFDEIGNRYYVSATSDTDTENDSTPLTNEDDASIFIGNPAGGAPTLFQRVYEPTANGAPQGMEIDYAGTIGVVGAGQTYTETAGTPSLAGTPVAVINSATVTDPDNSVVQGATIAITGGFISGDTLSITTGGSGISASYNGSNGVLTLTGSATFAQYQTVLASVRYVNAGDNPTLYGTDTSRTISFTTFDGLLNSDPATATVNVTGVNDAPVNVVPTGFTIAEDTNPGRVFSTANGNALHVSDVDADPASQALSVTLSVGHGSLTLVSVAGLSFTVGNGTSNGTMTFTGTANAINAALGAGLTYNAAVDYFGSDTLTLTSSDQGFNGTGGALGDTDSVAITITAVADITDDTATTAEDNAVNVTVQTNDTFENPFHFISAVGQGAHGTVTINDNGTVGDKSDDFLVYTAAADYNGADSFTYTVTSGGATETATVNVTVNAVADIAADSVTFDEDSGAHQLDLLGNDTFENSGRAITAAGPALHGTVTINDNGTAGILSDDFVVYTADADYHGSDSFSYTVTSDGVTETATVSVTVNSVNDAPAGTDGGTTINEDSSYTFAGSDFGFTDSDGNAALSVIFTTLPAGGTLIYDDGVNPAGAIAAGTEVTFADIQSGYVSFVPNGDFNGAPTFTFQVRDDGGTLLNGVDTDQSPNTFTITVTPVDDAPVAVNDTATVAANVASAIDVIANDTDIDGGPKMVTFVDAMLLLPGVSATVASGAIVTLNFDGTLSYDANGQFDYLVSAATAALSGASDSMATDTFSYTLNGGSVATVTVTINGVDGPGDELRGTGGDDTIRVIGDPALVDGLGGFDKLIIAPNHSYAFTDGQIANFEQIMVRGGATLDLSAVHATVANIRSTSDISGVAHIIGTQDADTIFGGAGADDLSGGDGDDRIFLSATPGHVDGGTGTDQLVIVAGSNVTLTEPTFTNVEQVRVDDGATLDLSGVETRIQTIKLNSLAAGGSEIIGTQARDHIVGGDGADTIQGGRGADLMTGGLGDDTFVFADRNEFGGGVFDRITDFTTGSDVIDLSGVDPDRRLAGDQTFTFIDSAAFTGAGGTAYELRFEDAGGGDLLVQGDINHDGAADFSMLVHAPTLLATDFVL